MIKPEYAELHSHSWFSFQESPSSIDQIISQAKKLHYTALALTDHDNLAGAMQFAQICRSLNFHGITGAELTMKDNYHLTVLVENTSGYSNLCQLLSLSHVFSEKQNSPEFHPNMLSEYSNGLIVLSGCHKGEIPTLLEQNKFEEAHIAAKRYIQWFGSKNFFIELQQNLVQGDMKRIRLLTKLADELDLGIVATNNTHYHARDYHELHDCLVAIKHRKTIEEVHQERKPNSEFYLKSPEQMADLFKDRPEAIANTVRIAARCTFDLTKDIKYRFPEYAAPPGYTPQEYLEELCHQAAKRRYKSVSSKVYIRLQEEFRLIKKHHLAGFLLHYYDIVQLAREIMIELGLSNAEIPLEERPPGRARGSSVAMLVGYLIGLSHIDPLQYDLGLERFLPEDLISTALDIDLDFPRDIREALIPAVHQKWGWNRAALTSMRSTYRIKGAIRDIGKALDLPNEQVSNLAKKVDHTSVKNIRQELARLPELTDTLNRKEWRNLIRLAEQLDGVPKYIAQHPGGMIISSVPLTEIVPVQKAIINNRYIVQWDKDDLDAAKIAKIDFLALGTLSQLQESLRLIEQRTGFFIDISRIDFQDTNVYDMLCQGDTVGVFQVDSAAQMQTIPRIRPRNLRDMAFQVACVRPGVGVHHGVRHFIQRRNYQEPVAYDHPLEHRALGKTLGIILYQDQINQLAIDIGGLSPYTADQMRRALGRRNSTELLESYWEKFRSGALKKGIDERIAMKIFRKLNGQYMFPEAHAVAFGVTSYQLAWLKYHYALEFFTALINQQPMGFWGLESIKEDAKRHGIQVLNPDINRSMGKSSIEGQHIRLGLINIINIGKTVSNKILRDRAANGFFSSIKIFIFRTGLEQKILENLTDAGALDVFGKDRRSILWEIGLHYRHARKQMIFDLSIKDEVPNIMPLTDWEEMILEYKVLGLFPKGHFMETFRSNLGRNFITSRKLSVMENGQIIRTGGLVARSLQHPIAHTYFMTLEDEHGFIPLIIWPQIYEKHRYKLRKNFILVEGMISRKDGVLNIIVHNVWTAPG